jgi:hypothetical protein
VWPFFAQAFGQEAVRTIGLIIVRQRDFEPLARLFWDAPRQKPVWSVSIKGTPSILAKFSLPLLREAGDLPAQ